MSQLKRWQCAFFGLAFLAGCADKNTEPDQSGMVVKMGNAVTPQGLIRPTSHPDLHSQRDAQKQHQIFTTTNSNSKFSLQELQQQYEAALPDIAFPLMTQIVSAQQDAEGGILLQYTSSLSVKELTAFYIEQMERLGWQQQGRFSGQELLLYYSKAGRFCTISIRPTKKDFAGSKKVQLLLFVGRQ